MKKFFRDFGDFIKRGNVLDLAVGLIIGTAFNNIVKSLVNDVIMPFIGLLGGKNIAQAKYELVKAVIVDGEVVTPAVTLNYGAFIQTVIDFLIIALSIFVAVKIITSIRSRIERRVEKLKEKLIKSEDEPAKEVVEEVVASAPKAEDILIEIRDLLKAKEKIDHE